MVPISIWESLKQHRCRYPRHFSLGAVHWTRCGDSDRQVIVLLLWTSSFQLTKVWEKLSKKRQTNLETSYEAEHTWRVDLAIGNRRCWAFGTCLSGRIESHRVLPLSRSAPIVPSLGSSPAANGAAAEWFWAHGKSKNPQKKKNWVTLLGNSTGFVFVVSRSDNNRTNARASDPEKRAVPVRHAGVRSEEDQAEECVRDCWHKRFGNLNLLVVCTTSTFQIPATGFKKKKNENLIAFRNAWNVPWIRPCSYFLSLSLSPSLADGKSRLDPWWSWSIWAERSVCCTISGSDQGTWTRCREGVCSAAVSFWFRFLSKCVRT